MPNKSVLEKKAILIIVSISFTFCIFLLLLNIRGINKDKEKDIDDKEVETFINGVSTETKNEESKDTATDQEDEDIVDNKTLAATNSQVPSNLLTTNEPPPRQDSSEKPDDESPQETFQIANIYQVFYKQNPVGTVRRLRINLRSSQDIRLVDLSNYDNEIFAFKWESGTFEYGLANQKVVPELHEAEVSDEIDTSSDTLVSELISFESNNFLFIKPLDHVENLRIDLINIEEGSIGGFSTSANHSSGAKYSDIGIIPREQWSGDPDINNPNRLTWNPVYYKADKIVVHHTATANGQDPIYWMKAIYNYHAYSCGWGDIGYNYIIDQYGNIYEGKLGGEEAKGYHAGPGNPNSIGVSVLGTYTDTAPSSAAQDALKRLIAERAAFYNFTPGWHSTIYGHRDFMATACPGNAFYAVLPSITSNANSYKNSNFSTLKSVVQEVNHNIDHGNYEPNKLILIFNQAADISIPAWSGIENYTNLDNIVTLTITSTSTPYEGVNDRIRSLYKFFWMDSNVKYVELNNRGQIPEIL